VRAAMDAPRKDRGAIADGPAHTPPSMSRLEAKTALALPSIPDLAGNLDDPSEFAFGQIHRKAATGAGWNAGKATLWG
jgi:hypothetical protein